MITERQTSVQSDRESVANLIIRLGHAHRLTSHDENEGKQQSPGPNLSIFAGHFIQQLGSASYSYLFEVGDFPNEQFELMVLSTPFSNKRAQTVALGI
jgi:hypothetical protein